MKKYFLTTIIASFSAILIAQIPAGYYDSANGKTERALKTALYNIIGTHTAVSYSNVWDAYNTTDRMPNGKIWDMYSTCDWTYDSDQCGNYRNICDCYNREHSLPKSWFNVDNPSASRPPSVDIFHLYPTDGKVNGERGNLPFGEVGSTDGSVVNSNSNALGKRGNARSDLGYSGKVFEPIDEYKGDFARTYFYMVTCYENEVSNWNGSDALTMLTANKYPSFKTWAVNMLLQWSANDPVSEKEIDRNNAIYAIQHNRNPFIDHPELAEYIWGSHIGELWNVPSDVVDIQSMPVKIIFNKENSSVQIICEQKFNSFDVINLNGQTVENGVIDDNFIQLNSLTNGLYFITLNNNSSKITQKLLVY